MSDLSLSVGTVASECFPMSLERFKIAQASAGAGYAHALAEMQAGQKTSHWIWYIFPQLAGLGRSSAAREYGVRDLAEAIEYLRDPILRARLFEISAVVDQQLTSRVPLADLMGSSIDALKLVSSLTFFEAAAVQMNAETGECGEFRRHCNAILSEAESQGFPRCQYTRQRIAE
jgi:uncharacterized protein (DUF1810 family)